MILLLYMIRNILTILNTIRACNIFEKFRAANLTGRDLVKWKYNRYMHDYLGCIKAVDDNVGRLLKYLDDEGIADNTIVVYSSDQGFFLGEHGWVDKRWIFDDRGTGLGTHMRKFSLYTMMGLATTAVFWMTELLFDAVSPGGRARYLGALIGLAIGYSTKYFLDRRFVFEPAS